MGTPKHLCHADFEGRSLDKKRLYARYRSICSPLRPPNEECRTEIDCEKNTPLMKDTVYLRTANAAKPNPRARAKIVE